MKSHTGATMSLGQGCVYSMSLKQKLNTRSSTEAELVAVDMIRTDKSLLEVLSRESKLEPKVYLEKIWPERWWKRIGGSGYSFYAMESEK